MGTSGSSNTRVRKNSASRGGDEKCGAAGKDTTGGTVRLGARVGASSAPATGAVKAGKIIRLRTASEYAIERRRVGTFALSITGAPPK
jgi:hypothetical protein